MSAFLHNRHLLRWPERARLAVVLGLVGGTLGVAAGLIELVAGPMIRDWVGNKQDTTRLGIATVVLAAIALAAAWALVRWPAAGAPRRFLLTLGLLLPGLICFTTTGRLWYVPGALLLAAAGILVVGLRTERGEIAAAAKRGWTAMLVAVLALLYVLLGATAHGPSGVAGVGGGLAILALVVLRGRIPTPFALALLVVAALPFAALTWWSVATPLAGLLLLAIGVPALGGHPGR